MDGQQAGDTCLRAALAKFSADGRRSREKSKLLVAEL